MQHRLASVIALRRAAAVPEALSALQEIAQRSADPNVVAAAQAALKPPGRR